MFLRSALAVTVKQPLSISASPSWPFVRRRVSGSADSPNVYPPAYAEVVLTRHYHPLTQVVLTRHYHPLVQVVLTRR